MISCPLAKRYASRGLSRQPNAPASIEKPVCRCVSPKYGRVGKSRPAYGEYGGLAGKAFSADALSSVPTSVVVCAMAVAGREKLARHNTRTCLIVCFIDEPFRMDVTVFIVGLSRLERGSETRRCSTASCQCPHARLCRTPRRRSKHNEIQVRILGVYVAAFNQSARNLDVSTSCRTASTTKPSSAAAASVVRVPMVSVP